LGADSVKRDIEEGVTRKRAGFIVDGPPARDGAEIYTKDGKLVGHVTSGTHSPSLR